MRLAETSLYTQPYTQALPRTATSRAKETRRTAGRTFSRSGIPPFAKAFGPARTRTRSPRPRRRVVEHRLRRPRRVTLDPSRHAYDEHPVAARDRPLDDLAVVRRTRNDRNPAASRCRRA